MGVAKYIKDEKGAIKEVTYQSGIKVKPVYGPEDLEKQGRNDPENITKRHSKISEWDLTFTYSIGSLPGQVNVYFIGETKEKGQE